MNSEFSPPPKEELKAQITALLLGELSEEEAAILREKIAADPELRKLHTQLGMTIGLVKEAIASPHPAEIAVPEGLKLSEERREKLLASFKVGIIPERVVPVDLRTWGALAAMVVGLLSFSYWMMGAFFVKSRSSAQRMAAVSDSEPEFSGREFETRRFAFISPPPPPTEPSLQERLMRRPGAGENASQDARFYKEVDQAAEAPVREEEKLEENRFRVWSRIELPKVVTRSASEIQQQPAPAGPKAQSATTRGFYDESTTEGTATGLAAASEPAASSSTLAFGVAPEALAGWPEIGLKDLEQNEPAQMENLWASSSLSTAEGFSDLKRITGDGAARLGGEVQTTQQKSARFGRSVDKQPLGEREIVLNQDSDAAKYIAEERGQLPKPAEGRSATASAEDKTNNDPLAFYRKNPELMRRYFPHLGGGMQAQQQSSMQPDGTGRPERPLSSEVEKLRRDVETLQEIRDSLTARIPGDQVESTIPVENRVQIIEQAEAKDLTLWERLRGAERKAVIHIQNDTPDVGSIINQNEPTGYDPYFIQTEFEKVKSDAVLGDVVDQLNLSEEWGEQDGHKLEKKKAIRKLLDIINIKQDSNGLIEIKARSKDPEEAARIANMVAEVYQKKRDRLRTEQARAATAALADELAKQERDLAQAKAKLQKLEGSSAHAPVTRPIANADAPIPQPELAVAANPFSTFSLNVSDVSFKLAAASLERGQMPDAAGIRSEEYINAFDYRDPTAVSAPVAFAWERARYPFAHDRDLLRFSVKTAASGREAGRPLNLVLLLDSSGSMERADRVRIIQECVRVLAGQLQAQDKVSVVTFARTPRLWVDGLTGSSAGELVTRIGTVTPEGGTNLEEAMRVGYETATRHFIANGVNRVVLLTDGAANLGEVKAESLKQRVEENRRKGIGLDCFGIGWEGLNDDLLEQLSRNGDGRYGFVNTPEAASAEFAGQLAGALKVAASDVKVQVEFNPKRVMAYRQIGYAKHQLTKEEFRDNTVDAAEIGAAEAGNALYVVQTNPAGEGAIATVRVRFKVPGTNEYREHAWPVPYQGAAKPLEQSNPSMRLAGAASGFSEWLAASPYAGEITPDRLLAIISNVPEAFSNDPRPKQLEWMIRQAKSIAGN